MNYYTVQMDSIISKPLQYNYTDLKQDPCDCFLVSEIQQPIIFTCFSILNCSCITFTMDYSYNSYHAITVSTSLSLPAGIL